jgi:hypothetical protein
VAPAWTGRHCGDGAGTGAAVSAGRDPMTHDGIGDGDVGQLIRLSGTPAAACCGTPAGGPARVEESGVEDRPAGSMPVVGSGAGGRWGCGGGGGWTRVAQADCMATTLRLVSATLRVRSAMLRARDSSVMAPPDGDAASERTDDAGSLPAAEADSEPVAGAMAGGTDDAGGGPDIADTKLLRFLALPSITRRL